MREQRKNARKRCFAPALLPGMEAYGYITDVSPEGLLMRIPGDLPRILEGSQELTVSLEELAIPPFGLEVEYRWSRQEVKSTLVGFRVVGVGEAGRMSFAALIRRFAELLSPIGSMGDGSEGVVVA